jgi:hypothetical protein
VTWRIYEVVRKIYYLKLQDLFSVSLGENSLTTVVSSHFRSNQT